MLILHDKIIKAHTDKMLVYHFCNHNDNNQSLFLILFYICALHTQKVQERQFFSLIISITKPKILQHHWFNPSDLRNNKCEILCKSNICLLFFFVLWYSIKKKPFIIIFRVSCHVKRHVSPNYHFIVRIAFFGLFWLSQDKKMFLLFHFWIVHVTAFASFRVLFLIKKNEW